MTIGPDYGAIALRDVDGCGGDQVSITVDCPWSSRQTPTSSRGAFKRLGTDAAKMAMAAGSVVERLDVVENIGAR